MNKTLLGAGLIATGIVATAGIVKSDAYTLPNYYVTLRGIAVTYHPSVYSEPYFNIDKDELVEVKNISKSGKWAKIYYKENGATGWVQTKYLQTYEDDLVPDKHVTAYVLNVRNQPGTKGTYVVSQLHKGDGVVILQYKNGWYYVKPVDGVGTRGWVSAKYIK